MGVQRLVWQHCDMNIQTLLLCMMVSLANVANKGLRTPMGTANNNLESGRRVWVQQDWTGRASHEDVSVSCFVFL